MSAPSLFRLPFVAASFALCFVPTAGCAQSSPTAAAAGSSLPADQEQRLAAFRGQGAKVPLAVLPALLAGRASKDVGDAVGLVLEQQAGLDRVAPASGAFEPPLGTTAEAIPELLKAHLQRNSAGADHALLAAFDVEKKAFVAVRTWIVDRDGELVWSDVQKAGDADFDRLHPGEPMTCCVVVAERVRGLLGLERPEGERDGPMKQWWAVKSSLPPKAELDAMASRAEALHKFGKAARVAVFPVRVADAADVAQGAALARKLEGDCAARAVETQVSVDGKPTSNQQLRLWTLAKAFQAHLAKNPVDADFALLADYVTTPDRSQVGGVNFVICTAKGEWVAVDFQNDHHEEFRQLAAKGIAGCDALVSRRLGRLMQ